MPLAKPLIIILLLADSLDAQNLVKNGFLRRRQTLLV